MARRVANCAMTAISGRQVVTAGNRSGPTNSDSPISVISARRGDGIARKDGEEDCKKAEKESRGGVQGKGGVRDEKTLSELAEQFDVHPYQITEWKKQLLERASDAFDGPKPKDEPAVDVRAMQAKIGQLALENDSLEGALITAGMLGAKR